jgi:lipoyl(octanoyl) transferase
MWRVIFGGAYEGYRNMAIDEAILMAVAGGQQPPTLRFYAWDPPTVSVGYFQSVEREVDLERCREMGFGVVRRATGGRAVLHDDEVTYSVAIREADFPGTVVQTYKRLSEGLVEGLVSLGIAAEMLPHGTVKEHASAACFDAPSWYEVTCGGKKIIGSAQVRKASAILQHGSVPMTFSGSRVAATLLASSEAVRDRLAATLERKAGGLQEFTSQHLDRDMVARALAGGLRSKLGLTLVEEDVSVAELATADELLRDKYSLPEWNLKR